MPPQGVCILFCRTHYFLKYAFQNAYARGCLCVEGELSYIKSKLALGQAFSRLICTAILQEGISCTTSSTKPWQVYHKNETSSLAPSGQLILIFCVYSTYLMFIASYPMYLVQTRVQSARKMNEISEYPSIFSPIRRKHSNTMFKVLKSWRDVISQSIL